MFVFEKDGEYYIVRQLNFDRIKRFAKALAPTTLWASVKAYYETLKGEKGDLYTAVTAIAMLLVVAGVVIAIILAIRGQGVDVDQLVQALKAAETSQNVTKVVVS